jgi:hypothetical protein
MHESIFENEWHIFIMVPTDSYLVVLSSKGMSQTSVESGRLQVFTIQ